MERRENDFTELVWVSIRINSICKDEDGGKGIERVALGTDEKVYGEDGDGKKYLAGDLFSRSQDPQEILFTESRGRSERDEAIITLAAVVGREFPHEEKGFRKIGGNSSRLFLDESMYQIWIPI